MYFITDLLCGVIVPLIIVVIIFGIFKKASVKRIMGVVLFTFYLAELFDIVGVPYLQYLTFQPIINIIPFGDLFKGDISFWSIFQFIANIMLFVPFGIFLPAIWPNFRKRSPTVLAGALLSFAIELIQLFSFRVTAIDDLLMNTLGTFIGHLIISIALNKRWEKADTTDKDSNKRDTMEMLLVVGLGFASAVFLKGTISTYVYGLAMYR